MRRPAVWLVLPLLAVVGCSSGATRTVTRPPQVCIDALDRADVAFRQLSSNITTIQQAFDQGVSGDTADARITFTQVTRVDAAPYKQAEAACRAGR